MSEEEYRRIFVKRLKFYMDSQNVTQADLIKDLGYSSSTVSNWCTGTKLPRMDKIQALADYFGINKSDLIENKSDDDDNEQIAKVALFGGDGEVTDEMWQEVKNFAQYIKSQRKNDVNDD